MTREALIKDAGRLGVMLRPEQWAQLERYVALLERWNSRFNLVSRQDIGRIWPRHILDSLSVLPLIEDLERSRGRPLNALDAGTGAGLPGLPLAIATPRASWLLVDRNARKVRFLELVASELALANVRVAQMDLGARSETEPGGWVDVIVSRAMTSAELLVQRCAHLLAEEGVLILLTGAAASSRRGQPEPTDGLAVLGEAAEAVLRVAIPGLDQMHEVTIIRPGTNTLAEQRA